MIRTTLLVSICAVLLQPFSTYASEKTPEARTTAALKRRVRDFKIDTTLTEALARYQRLSGVKIIADWQALKAAGVRKIAGVSFKTPDATVAKLLDMTLSRVETSIAPLIWYVDKNSVRITTRLAMLKQLSIARAVAKARSTKAKGRANRFNLENVPLANVIKSFRKLTGVNFHVNYRAMNVVGVGRSSPVTLKATDISFARALELITDQLSGSKDKYDRVYWVIDGGMVNISTGRALNNHLRTKVYNVADLLMVIPDFKGPRINLSKNNQKSDGQTGQPRAIIWEEQDNDKKEKSMAERRKVTRENLISIIKNTIGQDMWQPSGKGSIRILGKKLIISQTLLGFKLMENSLKR